MALTGFITTPDGVTHEAAYGLVFPLVIQTFPGPSAKFDFSIWHDQSAMGSDKQPIAVKSFSVEGPFLLDFIAATEASVRSGAGLITAAVSQMQAIVLQDKDFARWQHTL